MLTSEQIAENEKLTDEYGSGRGPSRRYPDMAEMFKAMEVRQEWRRLQREVVSAAQADRRAEEESEYGDHRDIDKLIVTRKVFRLAVDALNKYEADHNLRHTWMPLPDPPTEKSR